MLNFCFKNMSNLFSQSAKTVICGHQFNPERRQLFLLTKHANNSNSLFNISNDGVFSILRFNHAKMLKCWKCGVEKGTLKEVFCSKCNFIQVPHDTKNFFQLFDIKESFDIDTKCLTDSYRRLQNVIHPDKFSNKSLEEKSISQEYSSLINRAYNTLQLPLNRALHMLQLKGEKIDEDQKIVDTDFLMKIMEINEEIEKAENAEKLKMLNQQNREVMSEICKKISKCFKNSDIEGAKRYIVQLKYYNSISHHVNGILRDRGIVD